MEEGNKNLSLCQRKQQLKDLNQMSRKQVLANLRTAKEERLRSKRLYKSVILFLKFIPMLLVLFDIANTTLGFLGLECHWISYFGGISFLTLAFLYLASYVFGFCSYHRMFLHYIVATNILSILDYEFGLPISDNLLLCVHIVLFGLFLYLVLYFHQYEKPEALSPEDDRRSGCRKYVCG